MNTKSFVKSNVLITVITLISVAINFANQMVLAYYFGAEAQRDAYFAAMVIPTYLTTLFTGSFTVVFLPYYTAYVKKHGAGRGNELTSSSLGLCLLVLSGVCVLCFLFSEIIVSLTAPGFSGAQLQLTTDLFEVLIFTTLLQSLISFVSIFYHVESRFFVPALPPIIISITAILFVFLFHESGIMALATGTLVGSALGFVLVLPALRTKFSVRDLIRLGNTDTLALGKIALPLVISGALFRLTTVIERLLASTLPEGSISFLGYGGQIYLLLATITSGSIATTFFPLLSAKWAEGDRIAFNNLLGRGLRLIVFITLPVAAVFILFSVPIISVLFERGAFNASTTDAVAITLALMMGAFVFGSLGNITSRIFYITNHTRLIATISVVEIIVYGVFALFLSREFSYKGIALALSVSSGINILLSIFFLIKWRMLSVPTLLTDVLKIGFAAAVSGVAGVYLCGTLGEVSLIYKLALSISATGISYFAMTVYVFRIDEARRLRDLIQQVWIKLT